MLYYPKNMKIKELLFYYLKMIRNSLPLILLIDGYFVGDCSTTWIGFYVKHWDQDGCVWTRIFMNAFGMYAGIILLKVVTVAVIFSIIYVMSKQKIGKSGIVLLDAFWEKYYNRIMNFNSVAFAMGIWGYIISALNVLIITGIIKNGI
jgi:hypothetical protein